MFADKKIINKLIFCSECENFKSSLSCNKAPKYCKLTDKIIYTPECQVLENNDLYKIKNKNNNCNDFLKKKSSIRKVFDFFMIKIKLVCKRKENK